MTPSNDFEEDYQKLAHQVHALKSAGSERQAKPENECVFCKMAKKEIRSRLIEENTKFAAFLDIQPKEAGHVIVISKRHFAQFDEMDEVEASTLADIVKSIGIRMKKNLAATGFTIVSPNGVSSGQIVPHFALHIIPTYSHGAVDLPVMNLINPQKVPEFVMADTERLLRKI